MTCSAGFGSNNLKLRFSTLEKQAMGRRTNAVMIKGSFCFLPWVPLCAIMPDVPLTPNELLTTTRSVRKRLDLTRPVPLEEVKECLEIALQAPNGGMREGWHWIVVTDPQVRAQIGEFYRRSTMSYLSNAAANPSRGPRAGSEVMARVTSSTAYLAEHMGEVPVHVIPCITARTAALRAGESQAGLWGSLLPAAWSYMLACRARGLGTAWTTLHLRYESEIADLLGLPDDIRQGALIPTAYYTGDTFRPAARRPLADVLRLDRW
jgi:nitroreductase